MPKVSTAAILWPAIRAQMRQLVREIIREQAAPFAAPFDYQAPVGFREIAPAYGAFLSDHRGLDVTYEEYRAEFRYMLGHEYRLNTPQRR